MKILAVSDEVIDRLYSASVRETYPEVRMIFGCGDLPYSYLEFLVSVYDMHGSLQQQQTAEGRFTKLSMPVAAGMYIVKILSDKGTVSRKIIVR